MSKKRATAYIRSFGLLEEEERLLIACDVYKKSCESIAQEQHTSLETVKRRRNRSYAKIADCLKEETAV